MTESRKTVFMLIFATVLAVIGLVYGFSTIPNPALQRELKLDHRRVSDLGEMQFSIDEYYRNNRVLPETLSTLNTNSYSYSKDLAKNDPVTNQPYEYAILSETSYQLCANFTTNSAHDKDYYDSENYNYSSFKSKFDHDKGRACFTFNAPAGYQTLTEPVPDILTTQTPTRPPSPKKTQ